MSLTMNALQPTPAHPVATASWGVVPSLGNLDAYISGANRMPMLTDRKSVV